MTKSVSLLPGLRKKELSLKKVLSYKLSKELFLYQYPTQIQTGIFSLCAKCKMTFQVEEELRSKDKKLKEKDALLCTLQSQDGNAVMLAKKNQTQKAELRKRVCNTFLKNYFSLV